MSAMTRPFAGALWSSLPAKGRLWALAKATTHWEVQLRPQGTTRDAYFPSVLKWRDGWCCLQAWSYASHSAPLTTLPEKAFFRLQTPASIAKVRGHLKPYAPPLSAAGFPATTDSPFLMLSLLYPLDAMFKPAFSRPKLENISPH